MAYDIILFPYYRQHSLCRWLFCDILQISAGPNRWRRYFLARRRVEVNLNRGRPIRDYKVGVGVCVSMCKCSVMAAANCMNFCLLKLIICCIILHGMYYLFLPDQISYNVHFISKKEPHSFSEGIQDGVFNNP